MRTLISAAGLALALTAALSACDNPTEGGKAAAQTGQNVVRPGLGEDPGEPEVTPFTLPEGVRLAGTIRGAEEASGLCENTDAEGNGSGVFVRICVPLENLTGGPVQIEFPAGLVVITTSEGRAQNGLLIERTLLTLPPTLRGGAGCGRPEEDARRSPSRQVKADDPCAFIVPLYLYCLNEERDPSNPYITYAIAGVTTDRALQEVLRLLEGRKVSDIVQMWAVQNALYSITERSGMTQEDISLINRIPKA